MPPPLPPRFPAHLERQFQEAYYARIAATLRFTAPVMALLILINLAASSGAPAPHGLALLTPQLLFWASIFGLTRLRGFGRVWQPVAVALSCLVAALVLGALDSLVTREAAAGHRAGLADPVISPQRIFLLIQFAVFLVSLAMLRLQFRWAALLSGVVVTIGVWAFMRGRSPAEELSLAVRFGFLPWLLLAFVLLLSALTEEHLAREAFLANHLLDEERNDEKRRREKTEEMLHVLARAIGGIVHDLGNPLTSVQTGTQTLMMLLDGGGAERETLRKFTEIIWNGGEMLNHLRLSLMEQTRVLEGKPIPVELKPVSLRHIVETGTRYQKPKFTAGRSISVMDDDRQLLADEMKMATVFMNLIGNALKYSDGDARVEWREHAGEGSGVGRSLLIAVLDHGRQGKGITREQAFRLFTAFGRLDIHSRIEGTGLGLLSVQRIVDAHGGEAFIQGHCDGTPGSPPFSTGQGAYPMLVRDRYRTAFVVRLPLPPEP